ncbi:MAG: hypothetical protein PQJ59_06030 [Spirochaetales bacterium]|nr:hypothetical protein [Spirochaetales bacterium]
MTLKQSILIYLTLTLLPLAAQSASSLNDGEIIPPGESIQVKVELTREEEKLLINVASKAFTWMTGTVEQARYEPIGELANYFGFAKLRNEIRDASDNPLADENFRGSSWLVVLESLNADQRQVLYDLANKQEPPFLGFLEAREDFINGLYRLKEGNPLERENLTQYIRTMGRCEAQISLLSAASYGKLSLMLTEDQKSFFADIRAGRITVSERKGRGPYAKEVERELKSLSPEKTDLMTEIASKFLSYETGTLEDALFLPSGKIGNYFGFASYRYEDRAKVSRSGAAQLMLDVLDEDQKEILRSLTQQIYPLQQCYIDSRAYLIGEAYPLKEGVSVDEKNLMENYLVGAMAEGRMGMAQAIYFDYLEQNLSENQLQELKSRRESSSKTPKGRN